jgi:dTDP-3-amino-3,4,6-trideoxy-alpha-D-glucose transaminase
MGDGGAILTGDPELGARVRALRDYGQTAKYRHEYIGYNSRLDELQAAYLHRACLPRLAEWTSRRRAIACAYIDGIENAHVRLLSGPEGSESNWHLFPVFVDPSLREAFQDHLRAAGIATAVHYPTAIPDQPALRDVPMEVADDCRNARFVCRSEVSLPIHPYLTRDEASQVVHAVKTWHPGRA